MSHQPIQAASFTPWRRRGLAVSLVFLSPVITNLHLGSVPLTNIAALLFSATAWGLGSLLIRECSRRAALDWWSIWVLGVALALTEECVFLQTSLYPLLGVDPEHAYGREWGVNWPYLLWALGYESVFGVVIPILLLESTCVDAADAPWLRRRSLAFLVVLFLVMGLMRWYGWTQVFMTQQMPNLVNEPKRFHVVAALAGVIALVIATFTRRRGSMPRIGAVPSLRGRDWLYGLWAAATAFVWLHMLFLAYGAMPNLPLPAALGAGVILVGMNLLILSMATRSVRWGHRHGLVLTLGGLSATAGTGFVILYYVGSTSIDFFGKGVVNFLVLAWVFWLIRRDCGYPCRIPEAV